MNNFQTERESKGCYISKGIITFPYFLLRRRRLSSFFFLISKGKFSEHGFNMEGIRYTLELYLYKIQSIKFVFRMPPIFFDWYIGTCRRLVFVSSIFFFFWYYERIPHRVRIGILLYSLTNNDGKKHTSINERIS